MTLEFENRKIGLRNKIQEWLEMVCDDENGLGFISDKMVEHMTDAAFLIVLQNRDTNDYFEREIIK